MRSGQGKVQVRGKMKSGRTKLDFHFAIVFPFPLNYHRTINNQQAARVAPLSWMPMTMLRPRPRRRPRRRPLFRAYTPEPFRPITVRARLRLTSTRCSTCTHSSSMRARPVSRMHLREISYQVNPAIRHRCRSATDQCAQVTDFYRQVQLSTTIRPSTLD
jgi:hypothetical protein